jgi:hypothetical protein
MPFVYREVDALEREPLIGGGNCVALIKELTPGLQGAPTSMWRPGAPVVGSVGLVRGTAIATFENGRYPNRDTGNHAAFFLAYAGRAIWVMDQWKNDPKRPHIGKRLIRPGIKRKDGSFIDPSNAAETFSVIERR